MGGVRMGGVLQFGLHGQVTLHDPLGHFILVHHVAGQDIYLAGGYAGGPAPAALDAGNAGSQYGQFVHLRYDGAAQRLTILTDRYGLYPFYMARCSGTLRLGTDLAALAHSLGQSRFTDLAAIGCLAAFDAPLGRRTPFKNIVLAGAARCITIDLATMASRESATWDPAALLARAEVPLESAIPQLRALFLEAVAVSAAGQGSPALTLSGGVDSRCLLAAGHRLGILLHTYTTGVPGSRALEYATALAGLGGAPNHQHPLDQQFLAALPELMAECGRRMQGMSTGSEIEAAWLSRHIPSGKLVLHGAFAELYKIGDMHRFAYTPALDRLSASALTDHLMRGSHARLSQRLAGFRPALRAGLGRLARRQLARRVAAYRERLDVPATLQLLYLEEFIGKITRASCQVWTQRQRLAFPFAYPPLLDLILQVRPEDKLDCGFAQRLLRHTHPGLAAYPDANTGAPIGAGRLRREAIHVLDFAARKLFGSRRRADHQDFGAWLAACTPGLHQLAGSGTLAGGALDAPAIREMIERSRAGDADTARALYFLWLLALSGAGGAAASASAPVPAAPPPPIASPAAPGPLPG